MVAYVISRVTINDAETMAGYMADAPESVAAYGGQYLVRTGDIESVEAEANYDRIVVLEFPDKSKAYEWYHSEEYKALREIRWRAADAHIIVVPGVVT